jgi:hypothetical protein
MRSAWDRRLLPIDRRIATGGRSRGDKLARDGGRDRGDKLTTSQRILEAYTHTSINGIKIIFTFEAEMRRFGS